MRRSLILVLAAALAALALAPSGALAADSHAPRGARLDWLPSDTWVMSEWLPFDQTRMMALLHTDRTELTAWLNDHRTLAQLARRHGVHASTGALARRLVAPRLPHVARSLRPVLVARATDVLTQAHLSRHVLFHVFHTPAIPGAAHSVFGVSPARFRFLRDSAHTPLQIGAVGGRSPEHVRGALWALLRARAARGVRVGAMSRAQADVLLGEQHDQLPVYVSRAFRTPDQQVAFLCHPH